jgi:Na+-translocating ferredoxin:NAD+ oxidoreductase RnfE subunit
VGAAIIFIGAAEAIAKVSSDGVAAALFDCFSKDIGLTHII